MEEVNNDDVNAVSDENTQDTTGNSVNVSQVNEPPVTDTPMCSGVVSEPVITRVMVYDKKRYWSMINNKQELPFDELISKYNFAWCAEPFLNEEGETLAHAYAEYGVIPERAIGEYGYNYSVWYGIYLLISPLTGKRVFDVALANHTVPNIPFYLFFTGESADDKELVEIICPEAINFSLTDMIMAFKQYKNNPNVPEVPNEVPNMDLDNSYVKTDSQMVFSIDSKENE